MSSGGTACVLPPSGTAISLFAPPIQPCEKCAETATRINLAASGVKFALFCRRVTHDSAPPLSALRALFAKLLPLCAPLKTCLTDILVVMDGASRGSTSPHAFFHCIGCCLHFTITHIVRIATFKSGSRQACSSPSTSSRSMRKMLFGRARANCQSPLLSSLAAQSEKICFMTDRPTRSSKSRVGD